MNLVSDILIIDDERVVIDSTKTILSQEKITVDEASQPEVALQKIKQNDYKIIIMDLMFPHISGLELIKIVHKKDPNACVIVTSGYVTLENAVQCIKSGAFDFIPKPFDIDEFQGVINRAMKFKSSGHGKKSVQFWAQKRSQREPSSIYHFLGQHSWAKTDQEGIATIGAAETFPQMLNPIAKIEFPSLNDHLVQGSSCAKIITKKGFIHTVWSPLSGKVIENNKKIENNSDLLNSDPFFDGWLVRILPENLENELKNLNIR